MVNVLVTGFGPFPGVGVNPTEAVIRQLRSHPANGIWNLHAHVLPTEYGEASRRISALIRSLNPDICICFGVAGPGPIRLERLAQNETTAMCPDNAGEMRFGPIEAEGPPFYDSTLPLTAIRDALLRAGFPVDLSDDAGGYVCDHTFFVARHAVNVFAPSTACGFVHVPPVTGAMSMERLVRAALIIIETSVRETIRVT